MKAFGIYSSGSVEDLKELELPKPEITRPHDILVRVKAISLNPVDTKARKGFGAKPSATEPRILGYDAAGIVEAVGANVTNFKPGEEVYYAGDINRQGSNAEFQLVDSRIVGHKPKNLTFAQAAALPLVSLTAWEGLFEGMAIEFSASANKNASLLCIGGAGGVGSLVIQLAKKVAGLTVVATASRPESSDYVRSIGADHVVSHAEPLAPQLEKIGVNKVDYVYNTSNTNEYFDQLASILKPLGKVVFINGTSTPVNIGSLMGLRASIVWELMFTRPTTGVDIEKQHGILEEVAKLFEKGELQLPKIQTVPLTLEELRKGHQQLEAGKTIGKVTLEFAQ